MAMNENQSGYGLLQVQGKSDVNLAPEVSRNGRRVLGAINENIIRKDVIHHKNELNPVATRKCAAQKVIIQQKQIIINGPEKQPDVAVEEVDERQIPMYVILTEAMMDEIDCMDEVDMEDVEDQIMDIDIHDVKNELAVVEYVDDIYAFYRKSEKAGFVSPSYMDHQCDINERMRAILVDWLIEVHYKFELMDETLFLAVNLIDRFLEHQTVVRKELQLVGVTAMLMSCKYEEVSVPVVEDFVYISDKAYTRQEILNMEKLMLNKLQFNMSVPTSYVFVRRLLKAAQSDKKLELLAFFMLELSLVEYSMLQFKPSMLAAAAVYSAMCTIDGSSKQWSKTTEWHSKYSEDQLLQCAKMIVTLHQKSTSGKLTGVHRKYSTSKFGYAARCEPAQFLLSM